MCALRCSGQWDPAVDEKPCGEAATGDPAITSLDSADSTSDCISLDGSADPDKHGDSSGLDGNRRRTTTTRASRLAKRAAVAANKEVRNVSSPRSEVAVHMTPGANIDPPRKAPVATPQQKAKPLDTSQSKNSAAPSKGAPTTPAWVPSSCGASGSSCGGSTAGPGSGNVLERDIGAEQEGFSSSSRPAIKREAESHPAAEARPLAADHPPGWVPSSCGFNGGTCGGADGSGGTATKRDSSAEQEGIASPPLVHETKPKTKSPPETDPRQLTEHPPGWSPSSCGFSGSTCGGGSSSGPASMPPLPTSKHEAEPKPMAKARSLDDHPPGWAPMSCTIHGVTCGKLEGLGKGADSDGMADARAANGPPAPYDD